MHSYEVRNALAKVEIHLGQSIFRKIGSKSRLLDEQPNKICNYEIAKFRHFKNSDNLSHFRLQPATRSFRHAAPTASFRSKTSFRRQRTQSKQPPTNKTRYPSRSACKTSPLQQLLPFRPEIQKTIRWRKFWNNVRW